MRWLRALNTTGSMQPRPLVASTGALSGSTLLLKNTSLLRLQSRVLLLYLNHYGSLCHAVGIKLVT